MKVTMSEFSDICDSITGSIEYFEDGHEYATYIIMCARDQINPRAKISECISDYRQCSLDSIKQGLADWNDQNK